MDKQCVAKRTWKNVWACVAGSRELLLVPLIAAIAIADMSQGLAAQRSVFQMVAVFSVFMSLFCAPMFLFGRFCRFFYYLLFAVYLPAVVVCLYVDRMFGIGPGKEMIAIVRNSSWNEIKSFVSIFADGWSVVSVLVASAVLAILLYATYRITRKIRQSKCKIAVGLALAAVFALYMSTYGKISVEVNMPTFNFLMTVFSDGDKYEKMAAMKLYPEIPGEIVPAEGYDNCIGVFVLGESATRNHWSLYGYGRGTTPRMDAIKGELAIFTDVVTPAPSTALAMEYILTTATVENPEDFRYTLPQAMAKCGYYVPLYTAQEKWSDFGGGHISVFEGFCEEPLVFAGCEPMVYLSEDMSGSSMHKDDELLPIVDGFLKSNGRRTIFLHLMGSHTDFKDRYPDGFATFQPVAGEQGKPKILKTHEYDNSILFTDYVLGEIIDRLKKKGGLSWMVYLSDHGETPGKIMRTRSDRNLWEVPMIIWFSDEYKRVHPEVVAAVAAATKCPLQSDQFLQGILRIAGITPASPQEDFTDKRFKPRAQRKINCGKDVYKR